MNVLALVTDAFGGRGGIAKFNRDLLGALCGLPEVERVVAIPRLMPEMAGKLPSKLEWVADGLGGKARFSLAVWRATRGRRPALIVCGHIHLLPVAFLARAWPFGGGGNGVRMPIVLIVHGVEAWQPTGRWLVDRLASRVNALLTVSDFTRNRFWAWARPDSARSFILPNCVDLTRFVPGPKSEAVLERHGLRGCAVLLTVGRLSASERYKGVDEVLELMPRLIREIPNLRYVIVGDGDDRGRLKSKAAQLGVRDQVVFAGWVSDQETPDYYRTADAFVMPGRGEGFGIVYLEALACGVPVVASCADASAEVVKGCELAVVADPSDVESVLAAILTALKRPRGVRPPGLERFSTGAFQKRCAAIFRSLAGDHVSEMPGEIGCEALPAGGGKVHDA
jgi:glycosyltransferase involved in cell wall biosynthesis